MKARVEGKGRMDRGKIIGNRGDREMDCISVKGAWQGSINWKRQATGISRSRQQKKKITARICVMSS
jgi:hypothetical protein